MQKESKNKSFVLRMDAEMMGAIEKWAADEFRSVNGQIQYILDQALKKAGRTGGKVRGTGCKVQGTGCEK